MEIQSHDHNFISICQGIPAASRKTRQPAAANQQVMQLENARPWRGCPEAPIFELYILQR